MNRFLQAVFALGFVFPLLSPIVRNLPINSAKV